MSLHISRQRTFRTTEGNNIPANPAEGNPNDSMGASNLNILLEKFQSQNSPPFSSLSLPPLYEFQLCHIMPYIFTPSHYPIFPPFLFYWYGYISVIFFLIFTIFPILQFSHFRIFSKSPSPATRPIHIQYLTLPSALPPLLHLSYPNPPYFHFPFFRIFPSRPYPLTLFYIFMFCGQNDIFLSYL